MIPTNLPRFTAVEMKVGFDAGMITHSNNGSYLAGWIEPDGAIVSVPEHGCAGDYLPLFDAGYVRLMVEVEYDGGVSFECAAFPTAEQAQALINLAVAFGSKGGRAVLIGSTGARFSSATAQTVTTQRDFISLVRSLQAQPVNA